MPISSTETIINRFSGIQVNQVLGDLGPEHGSQLQKRQRWCYLETA